LKNPPVPEPLLLPLPIYEGNDGPHLRTSTYEMARRAAPGWDVYELERQWREWIDKKGSPQKPDAAFVAFCRKKAARENP
ncbi:MAG: plasmid replication initiator RepA, partial [Candidatus Competibacteraceae bacterium]|nr:plasmid replication initiator RepA [Candidatus Competibacteraceae bacterium]